LVALKKAIYSDTVGEGALAYPHEQSLYALMRNIVGNGIQEIQDTITQSDSQKTIAVSVIESKRQSSFISGTPFVGFASTNLSAFNNGSGFTCDAGVRIKVLRSPAASSTEVLAVANSDTTNTAVSYMMYRGDEMFFEVDNINKLYVYYPTLNLGTAPSNNGSGITFSFYAS
jgi:hypothetical protein